MSKDVKSPFRIGVITDSYRTSFREALGKARRAGVAGWVA